MTNMRVFTSRLVGSISVFKVESPLKNWFSQDIHFIKITARPAISVKVTSPVKSAGFNSQLTQKRPFLQEKNRS
jgi:hypothetical protein